MGAGQWQLQRLSSVSETKLGKEEEPCLQDGNAVPS